jgi:hypothetical protein
MRSISVPETKWITLPGRVTQFWLTSIGAVGIRCAKRGTTTWEKTSLPAAWRGSRAYEIHMPLPAPNARSANRSRFQQPFPKCPRPSRSPAADDRADQESTNLELSNSEELTVHRDGTSSCLTKNRAESMRITCLGSSGIILRHANCRRATKGNPSRLRLGTGQSGATPAACIL